MDNPSLAVSGCISCAPAEFNMEGNVMKSLGFLGHKIALMIMLALPASLLPVAPAAAHVVYQNHYIYASSTLCVQGDDEVSHGTSGNGGYAMAMTVPKWNQWFPGAGNMDCAQNAKWMANGLATAMVLWRWSPKRDRWEVCRYYPGASKTKVQPAGRPGAAPNDYKYNSEVKETDGFKKNYTTTPCANGYYGVMGYHYVRNGDRWYGGSQWSGYHFWPSR